MIIDRLWQQQPGRFFVVSTKSATGTWKDHFIPRSKISTVAEFVKEHHDKEVYFCPHGFNTKQRDKTHSERPKLLWSDMDDVDPREVKWKPTIAIQSSPGRYVGIWVVDKQIEESLNRRMSYAIGADKSGWDLTQVLRFPGTTNYKYRSTPRVRILWTDGPQYTVKDLERKLPADPHQEDDEDGEGGSPVEILRKYRALPHWVRRELLTKKAPTEGKRSEMIWKLENALLEAGVDEDDCFILIKASVWNKFRGRMNEDKQLHRELDKALKNHLRSGKKRPSVKDDPEEQPPYQFLTESLADVEEETLDWVWYPYLAMGELSILEGDPGLGKSYMAQMVSLAICDGKKLPSVKPATEAKTGKVAYFDIENSRGSVTKPRMRLNGLKHLENFYQDEEPFSVDDPERLEEVYKAIERLKPTLVVFDTLNTYIGKADTYKSSESQQAFRTFRDIAKRFECAVLVLRHLTKSTKEKALYRGQGSIAFVGLARVVMTVGITPDDPDTRAMAVTKLNVTKAPQALTFRIDAMPDTLKEQDRSKFEWGEFVDLKADDIISTAPVKNGPNEREEAQAFLETVLEDGEIEAAKLGRMAESRSISSRTLQRAADAMGIKKRLRGFGKEKKSFWALPNKKVEED